VTARRLSGLLTLTAIAAATLASDLALAQEPQRNVTVRERPRPDYDPRGLRLGGFLLFPELTLGAQWDDNIFATNSDTIDDFIFIERPAFTLQSNFPRHDLRVTGFVENGNYKDEHTENYLDFGGAVSGRLDVLRDSRLFGSASAGRAHEPRDSPELVGTNTRRPVRYYQYLADLGYEHLFNRINVRLVGSFDRRNYRQAVSPNDFNQNNRDRNIYDANLRTGYFISPRINVFVQGGSFWQKRDQNDQGGVKRDSNGYSAVVGTSIDITGLLFGEVFGGYTRQEFDDDAFDTQNGFTYGVGLTWNPTGLTSVNLTGRGGFVPTDTAGASTNLQSTIGLRVDHELLRNLLLGAEAGYQRDDFRGDSDDTENAFTVGGDVTYLINRYFSVVGGYGFTKRTADDNTREYNRNLFTIRVNAQL
jgi:hypothetical protein